MTTSRSIPAYRYRFGDSRNRNCLSGQHSTALAKSMAAVPPCFLVTGRGDFLRNYSRQLASALKRGGKNYKLLDLDEAKPLPHAFAALLPETPAATRANEEMLAFFLQQAPDDAPHGADSATGGDGSGKILKIPR